MIYEDALEAARTELEALLEEENAFQYRLNQNQARQADLNNTVESLGVLVGEEGQEKTIGLTEAMRQLYRNKEKVGSFTPMMMRAFLRKEEFLLMTIRTPLP